MQESGTLHFFRGTPCSKLKIFLFRLFSVKISKIPQRVRDTSSYAKIFAKHKANQPRRDETADELQTSEITTHEGPSGSRVDVEGSHGMSGVQPGSSRIPLYGTNNFHG